MKQSLKATYQQTAEMIFGLVASGFLFGGVGLLLATPLWVAGKADRVESFGFNVAMFIATSTLLIWLTVRFWNKARGFCLGLLTGLLLSAAAVFLGPFK